VTAANYKRDERSHSLTISDAVNVERSWQQQSTGGPRISECGGEGVKSGG